MRQRAVSRNLLFDEATAVQPRRNRLPLVIAGVLHLVLLGFLIFVRTKPVRVNPEGSQSGSITAYVSGPIGGTPTVARIPGPQQTTLKTEAAKSAPTDDHSMERRFEPRASLARVRPATDRCVSDRAANPRSSREFSPVSGPCSTGAGARTGHARRDDSRRRHDGDITVLRSTNDAFARSATTLLSSGNAPTVSEARSYRHSQHDDIPTTHASAWAGRRPVVGRKDRGCVHHDLAALLRQQRPDAPGQMRPHRTPPDHERLHRISETVAPDNAETAMSQHEQGFRAARRMCHCAAGER